MNLDTLRFCPQCQQPLPANAPEGLCPQCLIKAAAAPPSEKVRTDVRLDEIVLHALERDADRRYQHVSQVRDDVEKATAGIPSSPPPTSAAEFRQQDAREILATVMTILSVLSFVGFIAGVIGLARVLFPDLRADMEIGPVESLGRDALEFAGTVVLSAMALFLLPKARRQGRYRLARINAASLIIVGALLTFACDRHWFGLAVPYWLGGLYSVAAFVCWIILRGKEVKAAFGFKPGTLANGIKSGAEIITEKPVPGFLLHVLVPALVLTALSFGVGALCIAMFEKKDDTVLQTCWRVGSIVVPAGVALLFLRWAGRRGIAGSIGRFAWRFLGPRSWMWPVAALLLVPAANHLPRPGDLPRPGEAAEIFQPITLITPEGGSFRFLAFEEWHKFTPVYAVSLTTMARQEVTLAPGWDGGRVLRGFFHRSARWSFELDGTRFGNWKSPEDGPLEIAPADRAKLRPLVVAELNRRAFGRGRVLEDLLDNGRGEESSVSWQNLVTLLAWLSLPLAAVALLLRLWPALFRKK